MNKRFVWIAVIFLVSAWLFGLAGAWTYHQLSKDNASGSPDWFSADARIFKASERPANLGLVPDFVEASEKSRNSVVFIKTVSSVPQRSFSDWFFGDMFSQPQTVTGSGSGVIVSEDGFIVTNHHVIEKASKIEVILNNKQGFEAKLIGADPSTDLALLKIEAKKLKPALFFNSNNVRVGEWVLAVGNPFNLTSTVTAGIVSAKGRNLNIVNNVFPIESFIQTDAAINPGNSGGALLNVQGELVGINTAILSRTGSYNGYGFAIPSNIVQKVMRDLKEYGAVQRAFFGADVRDVDYTTAEKLGIAEPKGVFVAEVLKESAAERAGLKKEDLLLKVNSVSVNAKAEFDEQLAYLRPGDQMNLVFERKGKEVQASAVVTNSEGTTTVIKRESVKSEKLGAEFEMISKVERDKYKVKGGVRVTGITRGFISRIGLPEGFVITHVNRIEIASIAQLTDVLENIRGNVVIEGISENGQRSYFQYYAY